MGSGCSCLGFTGVTRTLSGNQAHIGQYSGGEVCAAPAGPSKARFAPNLEEAAVEASGTVRGPHSGMSAVAPGGLEYNEKESVKNGPLQNRHCTDLACLVLFLVAQVGFVFVTLWGVQDGSPRKLFSPRDYRGDYCGFSAAKQWHGAIDLQAYTHQAYTLNITGSVGDIAQELVCSTAAEEALEGLSLSTFTSVQRGQYRCACCKTPCKACHGVMPFKDFTSPSSLVSGLTGKLSDLTDPTRALQLFSPSGANGGSFLNMFTDSDKYFVKTCLSSCSPARQDMVNYTYTPAPDVAWKSAWDALAADTRPHYEAIGQAISSRFTFQAWGPAHCGYDAGHCVPFPGLSFSPIEHGWCAPKMAADIAETLSETVNDGVLGDLASMTTESFGSAVGDAYEALDVLAIVGLLALVYSFVYMVLLKFFIGAVIWGSVFVVFALLAGGGTACYTASFQCSGDSLIQTGQSYAQAMQDEVVDGVSQHLDLGDAGTGSFNASQESISGDGQDYRGMQMVSKHGNICQRWDAQSPHNHTFLTSSQFSEADLVENYCRNPNGMSIYIWCFTTDPNTRWELCRPLGETALSRDCPNGYTIRDPVARKTLYIFGFVIWGLCFLWLLLCCCLWSRIELAIKVQKVAASFVFTTPQVMLVPVAQTILAFIWSMLWFFSAAFLLSQVSENAVPSGFYNFAEANGNESTPGKCTGSWPTGLTWRYLGNVSSVDDPCSGDRGNTAGIEPKCWRCAPPRYALDLRFLCSFFVYLWNSEMLIAMGQCIIAGSCCFWFFMSEDQRSTIPMSRSIVQKAVGNVFRYHLGSLAFGAAIIAVVQLIRYILMYIQKNAEQQKNKVVEYIMCALRCCMWCLEQCLRYINKNAYIQIALRGMPFCTAAKEAFTMLWSNALRFGTVALFGNLARMIGIALIMTGTMVTGFFVLEAMDPELSPIMPMFMFFMFTWVVSQSFLNVFGLAVDSMLQCFICAEKENITTVPKMLRELLDSGRFDEKDIDRQ